MDSSVSHLTIVNVRVQINPKKINSKQYKGILHPGPIPPLVRKLPNKIWEFTPKIFDPPPCWEILPNVDGF